MDLSLQGKRALVCGSSAGIGKASAQELALLGAEVYLVARSADKLQAAVAALPAEHGQQHAYITADFDRTESIEAALQPLLDQGLQFHILVNNTGGPPAGPAHKAGLDEYLTAFRRHLLANQTLAQLLIPGMRAGGYGRIINVISTSVKAPLPNLGVSNTIRGAVANWSKTLSRELGPDGITVNNVLPGATETERLSSIIGNKAAKTGASEAEVAQEMKAEVPLNRFAQPHEVAAALAFLASPAAAYISGINVPVDGGRTPNL